MTSESAKNALRLWAVFLTGCILYGVIELFVKGHTHISMGIAGGVCFLFINALNDLRLKGLNIFFGSVLSAVFITAVELFTGELFNLKLGLGIWDYSYMPMNYKGQICLPFSVLWIGLSFFGFILDNQLRIHLFREEPIKIRPMGIRSRT